MDLPDFLEFEPFNQLKQSMGTEKLGFFELFDPAYHLTGIERSELERDGLTVPSNRLYHLLDFTLVYKNSRVWVEEGECFHVAVCDEYPTASTRLVIGTSTRALRNKSRVCKSCLQKLQYKGYDAQKARKETYSREVYEEFRLFEFWNQFHLYPVSEKREMRKAIAQNEAI